jgi:phenylacetate-CoA ligase
MGLNPSYDEPFKVWSRLPILKKSDIRSNPYRLTSPVPSRCVRVQTSGSSGNPLKVLKDYSCVGFDVASYYEGLQWYDYEIGEPLVQLWGRRPQSSLKERISRLRNRRLENLYELDAHMMSDAMMKKYYHMILKTKPKLMYGYASSLELFSRFLKEHDYGIRIPIVVTTAEKLLTTQRQLISQAMSSKVFDQYGSTEVNSIAYECPFNSKLHTMPKALLQIVGDDEEELESGKLGRVIVTDLTNFKMPMIRYELGDMAKWSVDEPCNCGRKLKTIEGIEGRTSDIIVGLNGNRVHGEFFSHLLESTGFAQKFNVKKFQLIQRTRDLLVFKLCVDIKPDESSLTGLRRIISSYLGAMEIRCEFPNEILPHASGKYRFTISELN